MTIHFSEGAKIAVIKRTCGYCGETFIMTPEEYALHKFGRNIVDRSRDRISGWACPECVEEIERIKNLE